MCSEESFLPKVDNFLSVSPAHRRTCSCSRSFVLPLPGNFFSRLFPEPAPHLLWGPSAVSLSWPSFKLASPSTRPLPLKTHTHTPHSHLPFCFFSIAFVTCKCILFIDLSISASSHQNTRSLGATRKEFSSVLFIAFPQNRAWHLTGAHKTVIEW